MNRRTKLAGVLFDMDGTLTRPMLDFDAIRAEIGITGPILEALRHMKPAELARANAILDRHELEAARESELNEGCHELLAFFERKAVRRAIVTRNSRQSVEIVLRKHGLMFDATITRECAEPKPHPDALHKACAAINVDIESVWLIGDGSHDIEAGEAAGVPTVWISHNEPKRFAAQPTVTVPTLIEALRFFEGA